MNILQICSAREIGGGETHLIDLTGSLSDRGHCVFVVLTPNSPLIEKLQFLPADQLLELPLRNSLDLPSALKLARFVAGNDIQVIHAHIGRDYPLAAIAARRSNNTPYVLTRHVLFPLKRTSRLMLRRVGRIIAVSQAVNDAIRKQNIVDASRIVTIHNGIDVERFTKPSIDSNRSLLKGISKTKIKVGMAAHLSPIKGLDIFLRAASIVASQRSDVDFIIAGEDKSRDGRNRVWAEKLVSDLGLEDCVHLVGWVDDARKLYASLDIFVSPSRSEPFGLAIIEAMASGVPVIATASEGACEIIEDNVSGRMVKLEDAPALARAIGELADNARERERLSSNAIEMVKDRFSLDRMVDATGKVYDDLVRNRLK